MQFSHYLVNWDLQGEHLHSPNVFSRRCHAKWNSAIKSPNRYFSVMNSTESNSVCASIYFFVTKPKHKQRLHDNANANRNETRLWQNANRAYICSKWSSVHCSPQDDDVSRKHINWVNVIGWMAARMPLCSVSVCILCMQAELLCLRCDDLIPTKNRKWKR